MREASGTDWMERPRGLAPSTWKTMASEPLTATRVPLAEESVKEPASVRALVRAERRLPRRTMGMSEPRKARSLKGAPRDLR